MFCSDRCRMELKDALQNPVCTSCPRQTVLSRVAMLPMEKNDHFCLVSSSSRHRSMSAHCDGQDKTDELKLDSASVLKQTTGPSVKDWCAVEMKWNASTLRYHIGGVYGPCTEQEAKQIQEKFVPREIHNYYNGHSINYDYMHICKMRPPELYAHL